MRELKGRVAVITGAAGGIGRALALHAADAGMRVVLGDLDGERLAPAVAEVAARGAEALGVQVDVGDAPSVERLAEQAYARFGAVHLLVNNAGIAVSGAAWKLPLDAWDRVLRVNLYGVVHGVHAFVPRMLAGGEAGHVVNVASAAGLITAPGFAAYSASKFGVVGLTEALHHDLRARAAAVSASLLCPSWVQTQIAQPRAGHEAGPEPDAVDAAAMRAVAQAVAHGIEPAQVAREVFDAVEADRFYIVTHPDTLAAVRQRTDDILQGHQPRMARMERPKAG